MKVKALVIGISNYDDPNNNLSNPVNDANDLAEKFKILGYNVTCLTNATNHEIDEAIYNYGLELNNYDVGIFYFAGHGMQINGENFLTARDTNFRTERDAKFSSMPLNKILDTMDGGDNNTNIVILDACRNNPFERNWNRSIGGTGLAPVHAPKGTLIAYATSPGQTASDGVGNNGLYTSVILKNLEDINITIEEFFKRVRNSVYAFSNGKQTTWEHTSLIGTFYFNNGVYFTNTINKKYADYAIKDSDYIHSGSEISNIIKDLKSYNWYVQNPSIEKFSRLNYSEDYDKNELFILGRNFLQTANGGENLANELISNIDTWIQNFNFPSGENYVFDGILYEIYFDHNGIFRDQNLKDRLIDYITPLQKIDNLEKSFKFIEEELKPFINRDFYFLKHKNEPIQINLVYEKSTEDTDDIFTLVDVVYEGVSVLKSDNNNWFSDDSTIRYQPILRANLESKISQLSNIPKEYLSLISNYDFEINQSSKINIPIGRVISRR